MPLSRSSLNPRIKVVFAIEDWEKQTHFADSILEQHRRGLSSPDAALLQGLFYGFLRHRTLLEHWSNQLWSKAPRPLVALLVQTGLLQLLILEMAEHAVVNETVKLAPKSQRGFVNALMRRAVREREALLEERNHLPMEVASSHPKWLLERWQQQLNSFELGRLLTWNNEPAPVTGRKNPLVPSTESEQLGKPEQASLDKEQQAEDELDLDQVTAIQGWPDFYVFESLPRQQLTEGLVYLSDPSTSIAPRLLDPQSSERVLDACAAPGGKSFQLAVLSKNEIDLVCTDPSAKRLERLQSNLQRLHVHAVVEEHDWTNPCPVHWQQQFDAILLDLPCTNTGVLRRRADARWRLQPEMFVELPQLQQQIAQNALAALADKGRLVWSTCSIDVEENQQAVAKFLAANPELTLEKEVAITPWQHQVDGAYAALLRKKG